MVESFEARIGPVDNTPIEIERLSDNGSPYIAGDAA